MASSSRELDNKATRFGKAKKCAHKQWHASKEIERSQVYGGMSVDGEMRNSKKSYASEGRYVCVMYLFVEVASRDRAIILLKVRPGYVGSKTASQQRNRWNQQR